MNAWLPGWSASPAADPPANPPAKESIDPPAPAAGKAEERPSRRQAHAVLAHWPIPWREVWGRRANALAAQGVPLPEDELRAYEQTCTDRSAGADPVAILAALRHA